MNGITDVDVFRPRALAILREGRCKVVRSMCDDQHNVTRVEAHVQSSRENGPRYVIDMLAGQWACTCRAGQRGDSCAHVQAVRLVTVR